MWGSKINSSISLDLDQFYEWIYPINLPNQCGTEPETDEKGFLTPDTVPERSSTKENPSSSSLFSLCWLFWLSIFFLVKGPHNNVTNGDILWPPGRRTPVGPFGTLTRNLDSLSVLVDNREYTVTFSHRKSLILGEVVRVPTDSPTETTVFFKVLSFGLIYIVDLVRRQSTVNHQRCYQSCSAPLPCRL